MSGNNKSLNLVFHALADPTRRGIISRLSKGEASVSELAASYDMALSSFVQHLRILQNCGLVQSTKQGRVRTCKIVPTRLKGAENWLQQQELIWNQRLDRLDQHLVTLKRKHHGKN